MGGGFVTFRGSTKLEIWLQLEEFVRDQSDTWMIRPSGKREAKRRMKREYPSRDWVLTVRIDK